MTQCLFGRFVYCCMGRLTVRLYFVSLILIWGVVFMPSNGNVEAKNLKKIIDEIPEGTVYSITMEVVLTNEQDQGKTK